MNKNDILILGKGYIGSKIHKAFRCNISSIKVYSLTDIEDIVNQYNPKIIINCIGYTGIKNTDDCELDKDNVLLTNVFIPIMLAEFCIRKSIKLIHIGSGCIYHFYSGNKKSLPITEEDKPNFFDLYYSRSKIYSERALEPLSSQFNILIPRIRIPIDSKPHSKNILTKLINYKKIIDYPSNSVTYIPDFIKALKHLIEIDARGIYNAVNRGVLKWSELLDIYKKYDKDFRYKLIKPGKLVRTNIILSTKKLEDSGFKMRDIHQVISNKNFMKNYIKEVKC